MIPTQKVKSRNLEELVSDADARRVQFETTTGFKLAGAHAADVVGAAKSQVA